MKKTINRIVCMSMVLFSWAGFAEERAGSPQLVNNNTLNQTGAPSTGVVTRTGKRDLTITIHNNCFGTNLRSVSNPLAPTSIIHANLVMSIGDQNVPIEVSYPAAIVTKEGIVPREGENIQIRPMDASKYKLPGEGSKAQIYGNQVQLVIKQDYSVSVNSLMKQSNSDRPPVGVVSSAFVQEVTQCGGPPVYGAYGWSSYIPTYNCSSYMGQNGPLYTVIKDISPAADNSAVDMTISFPGQTGFCGGYYSPLMLFFDSQRPKFDNVTDFPLNPMNRTYWPEKGAPGAFLAFDKNGDGKIVAKDQLFGDQTAGSNGFDALKVFDSNGDGFITKEDKDFNKLVLWFDRNGDGVSQSDEIEPLSKRITKISLKFKRTVRPIGKYAEERFSSDFWYLDKNGKEKKGTIVDMWFKAANDKGKEEKGVKTK